MGNSTILSIQNLCRDFKMGDQVVHALRGVSFDVHQGEFVTIMGTSGSGKSTMLNILGCMDKPTSGHYVLDEEHTEKLSRDALARIRGRKIGFVFQSYNLLSRTTAIENVELPLLYNSGVSASERRRRALEALDMVGLSERKDHLPSQLSGGQQQRVAIARALVNDPVIILADEATGNLDTRTSYEIMMIFQELHRQGKTIAFVTHEPDIATFSQRTITLRDGLVKKDERIEMQDARAAFESLPPPEVFDE
jgi:putative ABC transport system ATP-binding protein